MLNVLASPVRTSNPRIADGMRIYAVGDVHERVDLLEALLARIDADLAAYLIEQSRVVVHVRRLLLRPPGVRRRHDRRRQIRRPPWYGQCIAFHA